MILIFPMIQPRPGSQSFIFVCNATNLGDLGWGGLILAITGRSWSRFATPGTFLGERNL